MNKKMGRPKKEFDKKVFEGMCYIQCTQEEICNVLDCDHKTLERWCKDTYKTTFSQTYKRYSDGGRKSLRRYQFKMAEKNATMAIWLGKQYLGQKDRQELDHQSSDGSMSPDKVTSIKIKVE